MTKKRKRRRPEQIVKLIQDGQAMLAAGTISHPFEGNDTFVELDQIVVARNVTDSASVQTWDAFEAPDGAPFGSFRRAGLDREGLHGDAESWPRRTRGPARRAGDGPGPRKRRAAPQA